MTAYWVVLAAAALTTLVAAAVAAALATFAGQALSQAVRYDLAAAPGTSLAVAGKFVTGQPARTSAVLRSSVSSALGAVPFSFWQGSWSDPLGFVAGSLPEPPASSAPGHTPVLLAAALDGIEEHAVLVAGKWPGQPSASAPGAIPAALPASAAALLKVRPGDVLRVEDQDTAAPATFILTGLYAQRQSPASAGSYWALDSIPASGVAAGSGAASGFTTYGPLVVPPGAFPGQLAEASGTWLAQPDMAGFTNAGLSASSARVGAIGYASTLLSGLTVTTSLPAVLADAGDNLAVARSLLAISAIELLVLAVAALLAVARLLAAQRAGETALLAARGASKGQLARLTAAEVVPLALGSALAGGVAGIWLARLLASTLYRPGGVPGGGISPGAPGTWLDALAAALAIAAASAGALLYPVLRPGRGAAKARRGRQALLSGATRAGSDLALVALAVLACWQLRRYSPVSTPAAGAPSIDPVLVLAPALALAGGTVVTLRLLPAAARAVDRLAAAGRGLTTALAGWQFSRQPLRQSGAALLLVMAIATGTLALAQHQSWIRSAADQAAYVTGGDAQVNLAAPQPAGTAASITGVAGVRAAMAVSAGQRALPAPVVAIDAAQAPKVALLRSDQSSLPPAALLGSIAPSPPGGLLVSGRPRSVELTVTLTRAPLGPVTAQLTVIDATGAAFQLATAPFPADGRPHALAVPLGGSGAAYPLRLSQAILSYTLPARPWAAPVTLTIAGARPGAWTAVASSPELASQLSVGGMYGPSAAPRAAGWRQAPGGAALTFAPGYGQWAAYRGTPVITRPVAGQLSLSALGPAPAAVPAIATRAFDSANRTGVGSVVQTTIDGVTVPARIVATAGAFPAITGAGLVMDLSALEVFLVSHGAPPVPVTQWWLATQGGRVPAALQAALPPGATIESRAALAAAIVADPLSAAPQQALLAMAVAAALLAIGGFWVSVAANVRQRRAESAVLAALGVDQRSAAAQLLLEKLLWSVPAAALGLLLGTVVARLLVPAVTLSPTARVPLPSPVTAFDLPQAIPLAAAVAVLPALAAALVVFRRPDPAAELRAVEAA
jgi:hypothetical protein